MITVIEDNYHPKSPHDKLEVQCTQCNEVFIRDRCLLHLQHSCPIDDHCITENAISRHILRHAYHINNVAPIRIEFKKLSKKAKQPIRSKITDAGYEIFSIENCIIDELRTKVIRTGISMSCPAGFYFTIEEIDNKFISYNKIVNAGHCNELLVTLHNVSNESIIINVGDPIAQLIIHENKNLDIIEINNFSPLYNHCELMK